MKKRYVFLACCALVLAFAAAALAEKDETLTKEWQGAEPYWNPLPNWSMQLLADVPESEPANNTCPGQAFACGNVLRPAAITAGDNDYIYFTANAGDIIVFGTDSLYGGTIMDTYIHLYNADCSTQLAYDDDSGPGYASLLSYCATYTGTYVGRIRGYSASTTGTYKAFVVCTSSGGYGDVCATATDLPCGDFSLVGHTGCSTNDYSPPTGCTGYTAAGRDQVLKMTVPANAVLDVAYTSTADASIYLVSVCTNPPDCLIGEDSTLAGGTEDFTYTFAAAGTYYLILDSWGANTSGSWNLVGTLTCPPVATEKSTWGEVKGLFR